MVGKLIKGLEWASKLGKIGRSLEVLSKGLDQIKTGLSEIWEKDKKEVKDDKE